MRRHRPGARGSRKVKPADRIPYAAALARSYNVIVQRSSQNFPVSAPEYEFRATAGRLCHSSAATPASYACCRPVAHDLSSSRSLARPATRMPHAQPADRSRPLSAPGRLGQPDGVNFVLLCRHGTAVFLVLYPLDGHEPLAEIALHPRAQPHRRPLAHPRRRPAAGLRLRLARGRPARARPLLRPGHRPARPRRHRPVRRRRLGRSRRAATSAAPSRRSVFLRRPFHWQEDAPPLTPLEDTIIYELHVRGFTCHPSSRRRHPGHLRRPGREDPVPARRWASPPSSCCRSTSSTRTTAPSSTRAPARQLRNFWGYNSIAFAAPKAAYAASGPRARPGQRVPRDGPRLPRGRHRGHPRRRLQPHRRGRRPRPHLLTSAAWTTSSTTCSARDGTYLNFSGCGNTVNCNHPVVRDLLLNCLRFWVAEMHVDGLRFDLASVLGRDQRGQRAGRAAGGRDDRRGRRAGRHQADRRAVGRRRALPGRQLPLRPALVGVERPVPRRRPPLLARRARAGRRPGHAAVRQRRPLPGVRPAAAPLDQLHHLPRRLHALGPGLLQPQAQRGQRRGQPRRLRRQLLAGTAASRGRPTTRTSSACAGGRRAT